MNLLGLVASSGPGDVLSAPELVERFDIDRLARGEVVLDSLTAAFPLDGAPDADGRR